MKRFFVYVIISLLFFIHNASAQSMIRKADINKTYLSVTGITDYPPFAHYEKIKSESLDLFEFKSVFLKPLYNLLSKKDIEIKAENLKKLPSVQQLVISTNDGDFNIFVGAYAETKLFRGLEIIYPASVSNPIHIITIPDDSIIIKKSSDLSKYKGVVIKSEYFSDFVLRKIKQLNITYVETPYEAYEMLFTGQAHYILGSIYYNKIMASRYGIEQYLSFSKKPLFKIPVFIAITKQMKYYEEYKDMLSYEFRKEEFGLAVKKEILQTVNEELEKNIGILPPSFTQKTTEQPTIVEEKKEVESQKEIGGKIIQNSKKIKSIDEVLEGI